MLTPLVLHYLINLKVLNTFLKETLNILYMLLPTEVVVTYLKIFCCCLSSQRVIVEIFIPQTYIIVFYCHPLAFITCYCSFLSNPGLARIKIYIHPTISINKCISLFICLAIVQEHVILYPRF